MAQVEAWLVNFCVQGCVRSLLKKHAPGLCSEEMWQEIAIDVADALEAVLERYPSEASFILMLRVSRDKRIGVDFTYRASPPLYKYRSLGVVGPKSRSMARCGAKIVEKGAVCIYDASACATVVK